ncbi:MAG: hypothetical protein Q8941_12070 [Bacteroidota bacterium]|nr:hypothetical protein [Bacteroidota bacterium]
MKTANIHARGDNPTRVSLHQLVDRLINVSVNAAIRNRNSVVNNVSEKFQVSSNEDGIASVISGMLKAVIVNTTESVVYISARQWYDKMIELNVKDDNCYNTYGVALNLQELVPLAETIGGHLDITNKRQKITTISFRFPVSQDSAG